MQMDMADFVNQTRYVKYSCFNVRDEASKYNLTLSGYSGDVGKNLTEFHYSLDLSKILVGFSNDEYFILYYLPMTLLFKLIGCPFPT